MPEPGRQRGQGRQRGRCQFSAQIGSDEQSAQVGCVESASGVLGTACSSSLLLPAAGTHRLARVRWSSTATGRGGRERNPHALDGWVDHLGRPAPFQLRLEPQIGLPGKPYLTAWANSGNSGRELALRLIAIRQARLEPLALSVSGRERMFIGWAAASEEKRIDLGAIGLATKEAIYPTHGPRR